MYDVFIIAIFSNESVVRKKIIQLIPIVVVLVILLSGQITQFITNMVSRFTGLTNLNQITTGRYDLWGIYLKNICDETYGFLFGHGLNHIEGIKAAHNTYLEIMYKFGVIGVIGDAVGLIISFKVSGLLY